MTVREIPTCVRTKSAVGTRPHWSVTNLLGCSCHPGRGEKSPPSCHALHQLGPLNSSGIATWPQPGDGQSPSSLAGRPSPHRGRRTAALPTFPSRALWKLTTVCGHMSSPILCYFSFHLPARASGFLCFNEEALRTPLFALPRKCACPFSQETPFGFPNKSDCDTHGKRVICRNQRPATSRRS